MPQVKIGVLISGSGTNLQSLIDNIETGNIKGKITVVISNRKDAYGLNRARQKNIDALYIRQKDYESFENFNDAIIDELKKHNVELVVLAGYLKILTSKFIEEYRNRIINIHPSLIPAFCGKGYYGIKVHEEVIKYGVKLSGATVHFVDEEADTGPIIIQEAVEVGYEDTAETLQQKVLKIEHKILPLAVKYYCEGKIQISGRKVKIKE
ncbi:MAG: phosphoribosylglycinamide formyltransferase [Sedimentibacter sp.]|jgi:phosphoribosylglycinamide formyltransferase-1|nr:phosphoribosylglycinamide formyltransferase [Sedimentibacter sp.]HAS92122.1 phosphoribosylglycinamide formyltransferase [Clostridiales bacterium]HOA19045.1 phosphoribosylglycinamide formyltransferase [Sedimentibacter sp.]HOG62217.1 phosphoribosylglycinamide formyltransferase [Sedimentibacter sp.]HQC70993.1 phosphoribosylglycinamide formyltransferase [Sedimentibacter sp.]